MTNHDRTGAEVPYAVQAIVEAFSARTEVSAIALGGSRASGAADLNSDHDIYVFVDSDIPESVRRAVAERYDPAPEIGNTWFGLEDAWRDVDTGAKIDLVYFDRPRFENQLRNVIERHRPSVGYSTAFWFTARNAVPLHDRSGWFGKMQVWAASPYPLPLQHAIIDLNYPLLRTARASYLHQIEHAVRRDDLVSVQHRTTALLASVFDIVFAANRALHPGEKRLLDHVRHLGSGVPAGFDEHVRALLDPGNALHAAHAICDDLDAMLEHHGLRRPLGP